MKLNIVSCIYTIFSCLIIVEYCLAKDTKVVHLNEDNWNLLLENEWMVQFYAPWCPACKSLKPTWDELSMLAKNYKIAKIDVTDSPALSGRFFVTTLPTIFHVINGEFRQYRGPRDLKSYQNFIELKQWKNIDTISSWIRPDSIQMNIVAGFFKLSHNLKELNNMLSQEYGMPMWVTYGIFAVGTVLIGALLGLIFVCVADFMFPLNVVKRKSFNNNNEDNVSSADDIPIKGDEIEGGDDEDDYDDDVDDNEDNENERADNDDEEKSSDDNEENLSDQKKNSSSDNDDANKTKPEIIETSITTPTEVRKRNTHKD